MGAGTLQVDVDDQAGQLTGREIYQWESVVDLARREHRQAETDAELTALWRLRAESQHWQTACRDAKARALDHEAQAEGLRSRLHAHEGSWRRIESELRCRVDACQAQLAEREQAWAIESAAWSTLAEEADRLRSALRALERERSAAERERSDLQLALEQGLVEQQHLRSAIDQLQVELWPLRIKGARYDRMLRWVPQSWRRLYCRLFTRRVPPA